MLPLRQPFMPMEAKSVDEVPTGDEWQYEPKWDGFRCLVFRDGDKIELQSKSGQPLTRYFPDLVEAVGGIKAKRFVLDGEIVVPSNGGLSFDDLLQRIHPGGAVRPSGSSGSAVGRTSPAAGGIRKEIS